MLTDKDREKGKISGRTGDDLQGRAKESEKDTERYLVKVIRERGGMCLKYASGITTGFPDRICVIPPRGRVFWVELKSEGKRPRALQDLQMERLRKLGSSVYVCDTRAAVDEVLRLEGLL